MNIHVYDIFKNHVQDNHQTSNTFSYLENHLKVRMFFLHLIWHCQYLWVFTGLHQFVGYPSRVLLKIDSLWVTFNNAFILKRPGKSWWHTASVAAPLWKWSIILIIWISTDKVLLNDPLELYWKHSNLETICSLAKSNKYIVCIVVFKTILFDINHGS